MKVESIAECSPYIKDIHIWANSGGTTHYDSLQRLFWADQKDSHNDVIMTSLQGQ